MERGSGKKPEAAITKSSSPLKPIKEDRGFQILKLAICDIKEKYGLAPKEVLSLIEETQAKKEMQIPISIFEINELGALEVICKYMKEELGLSYSSIALSLNRNSRTIWTAYKIACRKRKGRLLIKESKFFIPASMFSDRKLSVLETLITCLKDNFKLRYCEIALLLNRDERNIWTTYNRAKKK